jgi:energy-coupling factor transporter ATP-binding protein EcfA2
VLALLRRAVDEFGQTVVMVTHDPDAAAVSDRIVELADGRIVDDRSGPGRRGMTRLTLRSLASRKLRTALTAMAIVLGVAMISGTYVLTDTIDRAFGDIFQQAAEGVDVSVTPRQAGRQP